jgi:hypothetical protein
LNSESRYQVYDAERGSHWKHFQQKAPAGSLAFKCLIALLHLLTLPFALLTVIFVLIMYPILLLADKVRGR